jgi:hypothetical protein
MAWLTIVLIVAFVFILFKYKKHEIKIHSKRYLVVIALLLLTLMITSYYVNLDDYFNKDNLLSKTGAAVVETIKDNVALNDIVTKDDIESIFDKGVDKLDQSLDKIKNNQKTL